MARGTFNDDVYVRCPYYRKESATEIKCTGLCGTHTTQHYENKKAKEEWKYDFCMGLYMNCPMEIALETNEGYREE